MNPLYLDVTAACSLVWHAVRRQPFTILGALATGVLLLAFDLGAPLLGHALPGLG